MPQGAASVACRERRSDGRRRAETGQGQRQGEEQGKRHSRRLGTTHDNFLNLRALMSSKIDGQESEEREREGKRERVETETFSIFLMACVCYV